MWPVYRTGWIRIIIGKKRVSRDGRGLQNQRFCKFKGTAIGIFCHYGISPHRLVHRNRKVTASFTVIGIHLIPTAVEKGVINLRLAVLQLQVKRNACTCSGRRKIELLRNHSNAYLPIELYLASIPTGLDRIIPSQSGNRKRQVTP